MKNQYSKFKQFQGKSVWITGASSGIGADLARAMAQAGASLILSARNEDNLNRVARECNELADKDTARILPLDITADAAELREHTSAALSFFGGVDILVNNAGISQASLALNTDEAVLRRLMDINFFGPVALTKSLLPFMINRRRGHIVVISSLLGKLHLEKNSSYCASKHALHGYFNTLRDEVWRENVKVSLIMPGFIKTEILKRSLGGDGGINVKGQPDDPLANAWGKIDNAMPLHKFTPQLMKAIYKQKEEVAIAQLDSGIGLKVLRLSPMLYSAIAKRTKN